MNNKKIENRQAFPVPASNYAGGEFFASEDGMTYHQWLTGVVLQGLLANPNFFDQSTSIDFAVTTALVLANRTCSLLDDKPSNAL